MQFDVYRNTGNSGKLYPYLVDIQSNYLRRLERRVVVPLGCARAPEGIMYPELNPTVMVSGEMFLLATQEIANVPTARLGPVVDNLRDQAGIITGAVDWMLSQGFG